MVIDWLISEFWFWSFSYMNYHWEISKKCNKKWNLHVANLIWAKCKFQWKFSSCRVYIVLSHGHMAQYVCGQITFCCCSTIKQLHSPNCFKWFIHLPWYISFASLFNEINMIKSNKNCDIMISGINSRIASPLYIRRWLWNIKLKLTCEVTYREVGVQVQDGNTVSV